jgi:hypothetical protein
MKEKYKVEGQELTNLLKHKGMEQEINRTFLHPLGIELNLNQKNEIEIYRTKDPKGITYEKINSMLTKVFQQFAMGKSSERTRLLGFTIQVKDLFRNENLKNVSGLLLAPERKKLELIAGCLSAFQHLIYEKIIRKHKEYDSNFDPKQFEFSNLIASLNHNVKEEDWIDVAAIAMMLHSSEKLRKETAKIKDYAENEYPRKTKKDKGVT